MRRVVRDAGTRPDGRRSAITMNSRRAGSGPRFTTDRRAFLRTLTYGAAALSLPGVLRGESNPGRPPNIVLIMADDMGYSDLGCFGSEIRTPHLDALAARGMRFTQFYNAAVCCPSRAALLTGLYPHQAGQAWMTSHGADVRPPGPYQGFLNDRCATIPEILHGAGYRSYHSGKWHVGESRPHWPIDRGFDHSYGLISGGMNYFDIRKDYLPPGQQRTMAIDDQLYDPPHEGFYLTDAIADHAAEFVRDPQRPAHQPFFLYLAFTAPHFPLHAPPAAIAKCRGRYRAGWDRLREERFARMQAMGILGPEARLSPRDPAVPAWADVADPENEDLKMAIYAAQIEVMDAGIGRVLAALKDSGQEDNTLVFFVSDNGGCEGDLTRFRSKELNEAPYLGGPESYNSYGRGWANASNTPFRKFKVWLQEGGISTPLIVAGPGVTRGGICREPRHLVDLTATCLDAAGAKYPSRLGDRELTPAEGVSLRSLLRGETGPRGRPIFWELEGQRAMRDGTWKLIGKEDQPWELYDVAADRDELVDLARQEPDRVARMTSAWEAWARKCGVQRWKEISPGMENLKGWKPK